MNEETKRCLYCREEIKSDAIKCKHCGSTLTDSGVSTGEITPETQVKLALASKYELKGEIGRGGMASVYKAVQKNLGRIVALKVVHQNFVHDKEFLERFHREAKISALLSHPNIVSIYDEGEQKGVHYMCMEYLDGKNLLQIIRKKGNLNTEVTKTIIKAVAEALYHAHNKGLIHRDIKSSNIIITKEGRAVLTDFGIAHATEGTKLTQTGTVMGTAEYMSPEQAEGKEVDGRSDLYSLGVVMYECLTGKVPFKGGNPLSTIYKIINQPIPNPQKINSKIPDLLSMILTKALKKDVNQRYQSGKDFSKALDKDKYVIYDRKQTAPAKKNQPPKIKHKIPQPEKQPKEYVKVKSRNWQRVINYFLIVVILALLAVLAHLLNQHGFFTFEDSRLAGCDLESMTKAEKNNIEAAIDKGDELYMKQNFVLPANKSALYNYKQILEVCPSNKHALSRVRKIEFEIPALIQNNINENKIYEANQLLQAALIYFPSNINLIELEMKLGAIDIISGIKNMVNSDQDSALSLYQSLILSDPDNSEAEELNLEIKNSFIQIADSYYNSKQWNRAIENYEKILEIFGDDTDVQEKINESRRRVNISSYVNIPNLLGKTYLNARSILQSLGISDIRLITIRSKLQDKNIVINQQPGAGKNIRQNSFVILTIGE